MVLPLLSLSAVPKLAAFELEVLQALESGMVVLRLSVQLVAQGPLAAPPVPQGQPPLAVQSRCWLRASFKLRCRRQGHQQHSHRLRRRALCLSLERRGNDIGTSRG